MKCAPRPLNEAELSVLRLVLAEADEADVLLGQLEDAVVTGRCDCGCPTVDIAVPASAPSVSGGSSPLGVEGCVEPDEAGMPADILIFMTDGRVSGLEYVYYGDEAPGTWPELARISIVKRAR